MNALILLFLFVVSSVSACAAQARPNIVVILADDMGYADLGVHGCRDILTPHLNRIASGGVRFSEGYANGSFCTPTRAALITGLYQHRCGMEELAHHGQQLPKGISTLPERLRDAGYTTGMVGKWHLGEDPGHTPLDRGFQSFFGFVGGGHVYLPAVGGKGEYHAPILRNREPLAETRYLTDAFGEEACHFIRSQRDASNPFFLYLAFNAVHSPLQATAKYESRVASISDPKRRTYAAMLAALDDAVGAVLGTLEETGQASRTLVVFTNDNGGPTTRNAVNGSLNTPLRGSKCETFEGGIRVPTFIQWPGVIPPGSVYVKPVASFDLSATVLAAAGADCTALDGVDLVPFVTGKNPGSPHDALFWRSRVISANYAARRDNWKFVHSTEGDAKPGPAQKPARDMLFDIAADPSEQEDLAAKHPEKLASLKALYEAWSAEVDADCRKLGIEPKPR